MTDLDDLKKTGKRLIYFAWAIEIIVALVSFSISISLVIKGQQQIAEVGAEGSRNIDFIIIGLSFFVIGIIELTKIPLATALYNAATQNFKIIFFVALIAVNILTIETIVQGLRTAFSANSLAVDLQRQELRNLEDQLLNIENQKSDKDNITLDINTEIENLEEKIEAQRDEISRYKNDAIKEKDNLNKELSEANPKAKSLKQRIEDAKQKIKQLEIDKKNILDDPKIKQLYDQIEREEKNLENYSREEKILLAEKGDLAGNLFKNSAKKAVDQKLEEISNKIKSKENEIRSLQQNITNRQNELEVNYNQQINQNSQLINNLQLEYDTTLGLTKERITPQEKTIDLRKDENINRANEKISVYEKEIQELKSRLPSNNPNAKSNSSNYLDDKLEITNLINVKTKEFRDIAGRNQIYSIAKLIKFFPPLYWFSDEKIPDDFGEEDLTARDLERAFWVFGGLLSFIISIIGTLVAFAGLHLQDKEAHLKHNKILASKTTFGFRLRRLISSASRYLKISSRYLLTSISLMIKPKIEEKIVEKEVEVEKIIEKPVIEEKIVYQKIEVPKEVVKKELVHVPLWTQDPDLVNQKVEIPETDSKSKKKK
ncbi:hypothetical protein [Candidatus Pelagibacter sp.]|uniref:hypothetical protein n=1 Tax=Candidatus Pelagibacter sp. TaxID=2024849 RepID=UPI003F8379A8